MLASRVSLFVIAKKAIMVSSVFVSVSQSVSQSVCLSVNRIRPTQKLPYIF